MEFKVYKLGYYLNARHSMDNSPENEHSHTFTIVLYIQDRNNEDLLDVRKINHVANSYLEQYKGESLNRRPAFKDKIPTIEHMGDLFYEDLRQMLSNHNYSLIQLDICENPLKIYSISDRLW